MRPAVGTLPQIQARMKHLEARESAPVDADAQGVGRGRRRGRAVLRTRSSDQSDPTATTRGTRRPEVVRRM